MHVEQKKRGRVVTEKESGGNINPPSQESRERGGGRVTRFVWLNRRCIGKKSCEETRKKLKESLFPSFSDLAGKSCKEEKRGLDLQGGRLQGRRRGASLARDWKRRG